MDEQNHKLVIEGNAFYEIDLECVRQKKKGSPQGEAHMDSHQKKSQKKNQKRQRD